MTSDQAIKRSASVIAWHLSRGHSESEAVARAWEHEPALTEKQMLKALKWAQDTLAFADALNLACELCENDCDLSQELPPPGKCHPAAEMRVDELMAKFRLPR